MSVDSKKNRRLLLLSALFCQNVWAVMPVIDTANLAESIKQTVQQINQYKTELAEYEMALKNAKSLDSFTWDKANITMDNLLDSVNTLDSYKQQLGGMDAYLSRYQSSDKYQDSPCLGDKGGEACKDESIKKQIDASIAQKKANDALLRGIDIQQTAMKSDAHQLIRLQEQAQSASGELQAIQAANQLASAESNQLLQIRGLMVASETAKATRAAALADKKARQEVADASFRSGTYTKSTGKKW